MEVSCEFYGLDQLPRVVRVWERSRTLGKHGCPIGFNPFFGFIPLARASWRGHFASRHNHFSIHKFWASFSHAREIQNSIQSWFDVKKICWA